jgi:hypothetical protein
MLCSRKTIDGISICDLKPSSEKRVLAKCDSCGCIKQLIYANYSRSQKINNRTGLTYCRSCSSKINGIKRQGKPAHNKGKKLPPSKKGKNHPSWKGGRYISNDGYVMIHVGNSSEIGWQSYKKEHTLVVENFLKRKLFDFEVVHHVDGNKVNNKIDNLFVTDGQGHRNAHISLQTIGYALYKSGVIGFDRQTGTYFLKGKHENS